MQELYKKYRECGCRVTTDTRTLEGGEIFFALRGENFDGNLYAMAALEAGASWAVVNADASLPSDKRLIKVEDPLSTMRELAIYHRNNVGAERRLPVIGLTGTNGKTTTKELIAAVLGAKFRITATQGNLNNDIGVPKTLLSIRPDTQIAVVEMGANHPDDIAKLVQVSQPDFGLITNVGRAHLLGFGSFEGVKAAKGELYKYLSAHEGSVVFINHDDAELLSMAREWVSCHSFAYGVEYEGARILEATPQNPYLRILLSNGKTVSTRLVGRYNASNVMAALSIGRYFGVDEASAIEAIEAYEPVNKRSQMTRTQRNTLIVDAYNANPSSMAVAIENLASMGCEKKLAVLGEMRELGEESLAEHVKVLLKLKFEGIQACLVGEEFKKASLQIGYRAKAWAATSEDLAKALKRRPVSGATVLVKGSRGTKMENTLEVL